MKETLKLSRNPNRIIGVSHYRFLLAALIAAIGLSATGCPMDGNGGTNGYDGGTEGLMLVRRGESLS